MKQLLLWTLLFVSWQTCLANVPFNDWWQKGNQCYNQKDYECAASFYEKLAAEKPENPEVYYNLGNTYYRLNKIGPSVLYYQKALFFDPSYKKALDNLALAENRINNRIQESPDIFFVKWWKVITSVQLAATWSVIAVLLFIITLLLVLLRRWGKLPSLTGMRLSAFAILLCICSVYIAYESAQKKVTHNKAVVMMQDAPLRTDLKTAKTQSLIPEGTVVLLQEQQQEWTKVTLPDGREGWIRNSSLEVI